MAYRGASPEEVEYSVIMPIESELRGLEFVRRIEAAASEGFAEVIVEIQPSFDRNRALQEVTAAVQRISLFPDETEAPVISLDDGRRRSVMSIAVYGDLDERTLVDFARGLEDGLLAQPEVALVEVRGARRPEIHVEIPQSKLRAMGLTLGDVAQAIDSSALDVPAGTLRTPGGDILLKTTERRDFASQFKSIAILTTPDGAKVRLSDIASVTDTFEETEREAYFNGKRAVFMSVYSSENQSPLQVAAAVRKFTADLRPNLPPSVDITLSRDRSDEYRERLQLLLRNGTAGLLLVLLALALFLELRVAFWTALGIPISILGSLVLLPVMGATINMITLFAPTAAHAPRRSRARRSR
jgi:multidrug efflux pump subunit AcrB